jgi:hypothetical protein
MGAFTKDHFPGPAPARSLAHIGEDAPMLRLLVRPHRMLMGTEWRLRVSIRAKALTGDDGGGLVL